MGEIRTFEIRNIKMSNKLMTNGINLKEGLQKYFAVTV